MAGGSRFWRLGANRWVRRFLHVRVARNLARSIDPTVGRAPGRASSELKACAAGHAPPIRCRIDNRLKKDEWLGGCIIARARPFTSRIHRDRRRTKNPRAISQPSAAWRHASARDVIVLKLRRHSVAVSTSNIIILVGRCVQQIVNNLKNYFSFN